MTEEFFRSSERLEKFDLLKIDPLPSCLRDKSEPIANIFCLLRAMF